MNFNKYGPKKVNKRQTAKSSKKATRESKIKAGLPDLSQARLSLLINLK